jgi:hypothetical protein
MGEVLATLLATRQHIIDPPIVEALKTAIFTMELELQNVELEEDDLQVEQTLRKKDKNWCRYDHLIDDARVLLIK